MVDKSSPIPLYIQIEGDIKEKILSGYYMVGKKIPSEAELMKQYGASRMTIRNAIIGLVNGGFLEKSQGIGTYVRNKKAIQDFNQITSLTEAIKEMGGTASTRLLKTEHVFADEAIAGELNIPVGEPIYIIERVRYSDNMALAYVKNYIVAAVAPNLLEVVLKREQDSLYRIMEENFHVIYSMAQERVSAHLARNNEAEFLNVRRGFPVLQNKRVVYDEENRAFELDVSVIRADKYEFSCTMRGRA